MRDGRVSGWLRGTAMALALLAPDPAAACSVCLSATEPLREAYYVTTGILLSLPFLSLAAIILWLRRAAGRRREG